MQGKLMEDKGRQCTSELIAAISHIAQYEERSPVKHVKKKDNKQFPACEDGRANRLQPSSEH